MKNFYLSIIALIIFPAFGYSKINIPIDYDPNKNLIPSDWNVYYPYFDEATGLWGAKINDEIVIIPQYHRLSGGGSKPIFAYQDKDSHKYGLVSTYDILSAPIYDKVDFRGNSDSYYEVTLDGKKGLINPKGSTIVPTMYETIGEFISHGKIKHKFKSYEVYAQFIPCKLDNQWHILNIGGLDIAQFDETYFNEDGTLKDSNRKSFWKSLKKAYDLTVAKAKHDDVLASRLQSNETLNDSIFGVCNSLHNLLSADYLKKAPIKIGEYEGTINELGVIDIPMLSRHYTALLDRNPLNIYGLIQKMEREAPSVGNLPLFSNADDLARQDQERLEANEFKVRSLDAIIDIAAASGFKGTQLYARLKLDRMSAAERVRTSAQKVADNRRRREFNAKIDAIANSLVTTLYNSMSTLDASGGKSTLTSTTTGFGITNRSDDMTPIAKPDIKGDLSSQASYNSDKRVYSRYDSMLSQVFSGNRNASQSEIKNWQNKMRDLRLKWESQGKSFPMSANENR